MRIAFLILIWIAFCPVDCFSRAATITLSGPDKSIELTKNGVVAMETNEDTIKIYTLTGVVSFKAIPPAKGINGAQIAKRVIKWWLNDFAGDPNKNHSDLLKMVQDESVSASSRESMAAILSYEAGGSFIDCYQLQINSQEIKNWPAILVAFVLIIGFVTYFFKPRYHARISA